MNRYLIKRIVLLGPALILALLFTMILGHYSGEIPPELMDIQNERYSENRIEKFEEKYQLNEALFYFSFKLNEESMLPFYYPIISWNALNNRFHRYLGNIFNGTLGYSHRYRTNVSSILWAPLLRTLSINIIALLFSYVMGIYLGYKLIITNSAIIKTLINFFTQFFYALPSFLLALILLLLFSNKQAIYIFPTSGWEWDLGNGVFYGILNWIWHVILPITCLSLGSIAFLASIFHQKLKEEIQKPYFTTALSKGLSFEKVVRHHAFRNALSPVVAISANLLPALISGSVIIESIFGIPGMGKLAFDSFFSRDFQSIYAITIISVFLTWSNWILADYMYSKLDPKINFE